MPDESLLVDRPLVLLSNFLENKRNTELWVAELWGLTAVRATEWREQMLSSPGALGVGIRVSDDGTDVYSYVLFYPGTEPLILVDARRRVEWTFGVANFSTFRVRPLKIGRNEQCPCGSGRKYKRCHEPELRAEH